MAPAASPTIDHLERTWRSLDEVCGALTEEEWSRSTGCPGWSVQDQVSHLVDYEAGALGRPKPEHTPGAFGHVANPLGESNEVGVDARRGLAGAAVLAELREVVEARLDQLRALTPEDLDREVATPAGPGTLADMLTLRLMDTWSHEQDIRRAVRRPGHEDGPAAEAAIAYFTRFLPVVVGKRAGAPEGATVVVEVGALQKVSIAVEGGRAKPVDGVTAEPTVTLAMPTATFAALVGGRTDAPDDVTITGDEALGRAIVANLGFMP